MRLSNFAPAFRSTEAQARAGIWLKAFLVKAANEGTNAAGAALVPGELEAAVIRRGNFMGYFDQMAGLSMRSDVLSAPRRTAGVTANWNCRKFSNSRSQPAFDSIWLVAKKLALNPLQFRDRRRQ